MGDVLLRGRWGTIEVVTPPTAEPVDLATARLHLRLDAAGAPPTHPDDDLVKLWTASAREEVERYTNRRMMSQTVKITVIVPGASIALPVVPVQSIMLVEAIAADGSSSIVPPADYTAILAAVPARLVAKAGAWPTAAAVAVTAVVGYPSAAEVPASCRSAILLLLGEAYELREAGGEATWGDAMPVTVARLLAPHKLWLF